VRRVESGLFPAAVVVSLLLGLLFARFSEVPPAKGVRLEPVRVVGWRGGPVALCPQTDEGGVVNVSASVRCYLFGESEVPVVWLGEYRLKGVRVYRYEASARAKLVVLELGGGGSGEAYVVRELGADSEVYALIEGGGARTLVPLARMVSDEQLVEVIGTARGAEKVEVYAYAFPEDFNASQPPLRSLYVTEGEVVNGKFVVRIDRRGAPFTARGRPLVEVNATLVLYTGCSYATLDLGNLTSKPGRVSLQVDLSCEGRPRDSSPG